MSVSIVQNNYPAFSNNAGVSGKRIVAFISYGASATSQNPVWNLVGGLTSLTQSLSTSTSDANTRDNGYYSESVITSKQLTISLDLIAKRDALALAVIDSFCYDDAITSSKQALDLAIVDLDTLEYTRMQVVPTSWEMTADSEDMVKYSLSATCTGNPTKATSFVVPS